MRVWMAGGFAQLLGYDSHGDNVGVTNACGSTLMKKLNAGQPFCAELSKWVYAKNIKLPGLVSRRAAERHMCEVGTWS